MRDAAEIIELLNLAPHPEGGHYVETFRAAGVECERGAGTAIYFLLKAGEQSHWHRIDATEIWHHYAGAPLELLSSADGVGVSRRLLGANFEADERPQLIIEPGQWQAARSMGDWTLVGCTVSPAFEFEHFEMAPPNWEPGQKGGE